GAADTGPHPRPRPDRRFRLELHPHLWAADRAPELHERSGAEHWAPTPTDGGWPGHAVHRWAAEAEILRAADGCTGPVAVRLGNGHRFLIGDEAPGPRPVPACGVLPYAATWTPPDLELLHAAMISADRLHPLVAEALAPPTPDGAVRQVTVDGGVRQVECRGETHRLAVVGGRLVPLDHEPGQLRREELLTVFGGPPVPCLQLISADARNPLWLDDVRARLDHGDRAGATELVTTRLGTDVPIEGPLREAFDDAAAGLVEHGLYRAGLTGRIPPLERRDHERNRRGRTRWKPRPHRPGQHGPDIPPAWALR
ncbi:MAG TPA: hypothetical protein VN408_25980, partial [Actinoplanes sp.]|nr:hypothetical protein [Actinoplanes sp.]